MATANSTVIYLDVPDAPGYRVGDDGSVWSRWGKTFTREGSVFNCRAELTATWHRLKPFRASKRGHLRVAFGGRDFRRVHRLVLEAFVGPCPHGMQCCHNDGDPSNNALSNLRWDTPKANRADAIRHKRVPRGTAHARSKLTDDQVRAIRADYTTGVGYKRLSSKYGVTRSTIRNIVSRTSWTHIG